MEHVSFSINIERPQIINGWKIWAGHFIQKSDGILDSFCGVRRGRASAQEKGKDKDCGQSTWTECLQEEMPIYFHGFIFMVLFYHG